MSLERSIDASFLLEFALGLLEFTMETSNCCLRLTLTLCQFDALIKYRMITGPSLKPMALIPQSPIRGSETGVLSSFNRDLDEDLFKISGPCLQGHLQ